MSETNGAETGPVRVRRTRGLAAIIAADEHSALLVALIKDLPSRHRRFDKVAAVWRVNIVDVPALIERLRVNGFVVHDERAAQPPSSRRQSVSRGGAMSITAKVTCSSKTENGVDDRRYATLAFAPDYTDGRNKEWSLATPSLHLQMIVRGDVGDRFEAGKPYTLTFEAGA